MSTSKPQSGSVQEKVLDKRPIDSDDDSDRDINDIFNDIVLSEERISDEAYEEGFSDGELAGNIDGYHLGFHRGADIGCELGYYYGILSVQKTELATSSERTINAVETVLNLIDTYPRTNDEHVDIFAELEKIRALFRKTCALLKISTSIMIHEELREQVRFHLDECWQFLTPLLPMANCNMVTFITHKLYEKHVPMAIQNEIKSATHIDEAIDIYFNQVNGEAKVEQITGFQQFQKHLADMRNHTLDRIENIWIGTDELKTVIGRKTNDSLNIKGFMSEKKNHEVEEAADAIASICGSTASAGNLYVVDAGGGKGYLSTYLALEHDIKVLGVDWNPDNTINALNRSEKLAKMWNSLKNRAVEKITNPTLKKVGRRNRGKSKLSDVLTDKVDSKVTAPATNDNYKTLTHYITCQTNFLELISEHFDIPATTDFPGICLAGLHTCGDLGPSCLRIYNSSEHIVSVCNIGCCYNMLNEKYEIITFKRMPRERDERSRSPTRCESIIPLDELNTFGFPMSQYLDERKTALGRNARMLSCQSFHRIVASHEKPHNHLFYRALLEVLIAQTFPEYENLIEIGKLKTCSTFAEYTRKASNRCVHINFDNMTDDQLNQFYAAHINDEREMHLFYLLRISIAAVIETIILLDRLLYLLEMDELNSNAECKRHSYLVRLFDPVISPRCYGLVGLKF